MMEQSVKVTWEEKEVEVILQPLLWGDIKSVREQCIVIKEYKGMPMQFKNIDLMDDLKIVASIKTSPFPKTMESINKLTEEDRYKLATGVATLDDDSSKSKPDK